MSAGDGRRVLARAGRRALVRLALPISLAAAGCSQGGSAGEDAGPPASATASTGVPAASASPPDPGPPPAPGPTAREGSAVARAPSSDALYVADEDHRAIHVVPLPLDPARPARAVALPGPPAQVLALGDRVLVTVRDPGLLVVLRPDPAAGLAEVARVALPPDAWGLAVTPDGGTALVTSAWAHKVSAVDLATAAPRWSIDVAREPRGVVVRADGAAAYVTHLVGAALTRVDGLAEAAPSARRVELPACPLRAPSGRALGASLGYAAALSDDGGRLYVARHALGAMGKDAWFGAATVDVLLTAGDAPLAPKHFGNMLFLRADRGAESEEIKLPGGPLAPFTQPRAIVYRKRTSTVLVAGEGDDLIAELDALSADPTLAVVRTYKVGAGYNPALPVASSCGAPAGIALSEDEATAWVFCRATYDVAELALDPMREGAPFTPEPPRTVRLGDEPIDAVVATGRRLFYNATDRIMSGGLGCAGCHPEGRDDGYVWHEAKINTAEGTAVNFVGVPENAPDEDRTKGYPRRTPMLAGRVGASGPYGWHAESPDLEDRIRNGFTLHRWGVMPKHEQVQLAARAGHVAAFLRRGLTPPPSRSRELTPEEARGREVFRSEEARCSRCHVPETGYTDRMAYPLLPKLAVRSDFDDEEKKEFKTPSLLFVGGTAPHFHDGSAGSLEELVERNGDRMGRTSHLTREERAALVAFLRTL